MLSYHNDAKLKELMVIEMKKHKEKDQFIKGVYKKNENEKEFKGCAVGCSIDSINKILHKNYNNNSHKVFEEAIGVPQWLAILQDIFFENLSSEENSEFAINFLEAIPVGVNLGPVKWKFCAFILKQNLDIVSNLSNISEELKENVIQSIQKVLNIHESSIKSGEWDIESAELAADSAGLAADSAWSAERSAAESAAESARSARLAARSAGLAAESARSARSARLAAESAGSAESARLAARSARSAGLAAESARLAGSAAGLAAESAGSAARLAAESAGSAARLAAESAAESARSAAWLAEWSAAYTRYASELIRLLKDEGNDVKG
jgi:hypothetical protein